MTQEPDELQSLLRELGDEEHPIGFTRLSALSDLAGQRLESFRAAWEGFTAERRRRLVHALVELADSSFEVSFDAIFRFCLDDEDDLVRADAISGLWEDEHPSLIGRFLGILRGDPSPLARAAAAKGLGRFVLAGELEELEAVVHHRLVTELMAVLARPKESAEVRRRAVESVAYSCTPEVMDAIETAYYDDNELMRLSAIVGMGRSCEERWRPLILAELDSPTPAMRYEAALASGEMELKSAVPPLARLIADSDTQVRFAAIWALGQIGGNSARRVLLQAYEDADEDTEAALDDALAEIALLQGDLDFALGEPDEDDEAPGTDSWDGEGDLDEADGDWLDDGEEPSWADSEEGEMVGDELADLDEDEF